MLHKTSSKLVCFCEKDMSWSFGTLSAFKAEGQGAQHAVGL